MQYVSHTLRGKIHSDIWGPANPQSYNGRLYYINFTDDYTRWTTIYCINKKLNIFNKYKEYEAWLKTQYGKQIKVLQSDRGGEYLSNEFTKHLKGKGTIRTLTVHDTPEENGVVEQLNRTLLEHVCAMLMTAELPKNLWPETIHHAVWLKNRTSTQAPNGKTPFEVMHNAKLNLSDLPDWDTRVFMLRNSTGKLDSKAMEGH